MWLGQAQKDMRYMKQISVNPKSVFFPVQPNKAQVRSNTESIIYHRPILYHFTNQIQISVETLYGRLFSTILSQYIWRFNRIIRIQVCNEDRVCFHRCKGTGVQWRDVNSSVKLELTHWKRLWCWEGVGARGEGDDRGWDGWMPAPTRWTWVWVNSGSWWGQGGLACCDPWGRKESDTTERMIWSDLIWYFGLGRWKIRLEIGVRLQRRKIQQLKSSAYECILGNVAKWTWGFW